MSLFVGNISNTLHLGDLEDEFRRYGFCEMDYQGRYCIVNYRNKKDAEHAKDKIEKMGSEMP